MLIWNIPISSVDKALNSLGYKYGYALPKPQLPNPINIVMVYAQKVLFSFITVYLLSHRNMSGSLREQELQWEHKPQASIFTAFLSSPKLSQVFL